jgi:hypothetical protein
MMNTKLNMKKVAFIGVLLMLFACKKKDEDVILIIGETADYEITSHNLFAQGFDDGPTFNGEYVDIDLDNNGSADMRFLSYEDSVNYPELAANYWIDAKVLDDKFTFLEKPGTDDEYELSTTVEDYYGTYPRKTTVIESYCELVEGAVYNNSNLRKSKIFKLLDKVSIDEVFEAKYDLSSQSFNVYKESVEEAYWEFTIDSDSLFGQHFKPMSLCEGAPFNELFYIAFKYDAGGTVKYGWVELIVTNNNKITVKRSGISVL